MKRNRLYPTFISLFLCVALLLQIAPSLPARAQAESEPSQEIKYPDGLAATPQENKPTIQGEVLSERTANTKRFRQSDGSFLVASYREPIHYLTAEGYQEIDNTLLPQKNKSGEATGYLVNQAGAFTARFAESFNTGSLLEVSLDNSYIRVTPISSIKESKAVPAAAAQAAVAARAQAPAGLDAHLWAGKSQSGVTYTNVFPAADLSYTLSGAGVKENIIIREKADAYTYIFLLETGLLAQLQQDGSVALYEKMPEEPAFIIPAPYMLDAAGESSNAVTYTVTKVEGGYQFTVNADSAWVNKAQLPVTVDPSIIVNGSANLQDAYVRSAYPTSNYNNDQLIAGRNGASGSFRSLVKFTLPVLKKGDMVTNAYLGFGYTSLTVSGASPLQLNAYRITSSWSQTTATWNNTTFAASPVSDFTLTASSTSTPAVMLWNITSITRDWYNGSANNGILIASADENYTAYGNFVSSNSSSDVPYLYLEYRNNKGLEGYWSYHNASAGRAGTAYVNDFSGNLVATFGDFSWSGNRMPVSLSHIYNGNMANLQFNSTNAYTAPYTNMLIGRGWKLNLQQSVIATSTLGLDGFDTAAYPYVYTDGDGTEHYFYNTGTELVDEDGLGYTLTVQAGNGYFITDKQKNKLYFNTAGYLTSMRDNNGNWQTITYDSVYTSRISTVTDGAGRVTHFYYNANHAIQYITDPDNRRYDFYYSSTYNGTTNQSYTDFLRQIEMPGDVSVYYEYNSDGTLYRMTDLDSTKLEFSYNARSQVNSVKELSSTNAVGQELRSIYYPDNSVIFYSTGKNDVFDSNPLAIEDDIYTRYLFDSYGRTVNQYTYTPSIHVLMGENDNEIGSSALSYSGGSAMDISAGQTAYQMNKLKSGAVQGMYAENLLKNHSAEATRDWTSEILDGTLGSGYTLDYNTTQKLLGSKSLRSTVTVTNTVRAGWSQTLTSLTAGETYTFSAYVKTSIVASGQFGAYICAAVTGSSGTSTYYSPYITGTTDTALDNGWQRLIVTFTAPAGFTSCKLNFGLRASTGSAWFDCLQLEKGSQANLYNLIENPGFEWNGAWTLTGDNSGYATTYSRKGDYSYGFNASPTADKYISQAIPVNLSGAQTFVLSGWVRSTSSELSNPDRKLQLRVNILYSDATSETVTLKYQALLYNSIVSNWQYISGAIVPNAAKTVSSVTVQAVYGKNTGAAYFDTLTLVRDSAPSYVTDSKGNVTGARQNVDSETTSEFDANNNLTVLNNPTGYNYTYTYNSVTNDLATATNEAGITTVYSYDAYGNPLTSVTGPASMTLGSSAVYANGNYLSTVTDSRGKTITSSYDSDNGLLQYTEDAKGGRVAYLYNANTYAVNTIFNDKNDNGTAESTEARVDYAYNSSLRLVGVTHNGFTYYFDYDTFGNNYKISVGEQALVTSTYGSNNGKLYQKLYGNNYTETYVYDDQERIYQVNSGANVLAQYSYDALGRIVTVSGYNAGSTSYTYDLLGRVSTSAFSNSGTGWSDLLRTQYTYDTAGRMNKLVLKYNTDAARTYSTSYGQDNRINSITTPAGTYSYTYDALGRRSSSAVFIGMNSMAATYGYLAGVSVNGSTNPSTTLVNSITYSMGGGYTYTYDDNGNITYVYKNGSIEARYTYDDLNQLTREDNALQNRTTVYTYDLGGNITVKTFYALTYGTLGAEQSHIDYGYDATWKDKLTSYNGSAITYDEIGNPLSYRGYTATWTRGRMLSGLSGNGKIITYTYNQDGLRISKNNGTLSRYIYNGSSLIREQRGTSGIEYIYDASGVAGMYYGGEYYYFQKNLQGDIVKIFDDTRTLVAQYAYDAWGSPLYIRDGSGTDVSGTASHIANINPFRYRGYYYDTDTGYYYLQSRYYDPQVGRFLNADGIIGANGDLLAYNMFAYCSNRPILNQDPSGNRIQLYKHATKNDIKQFQNAIWYLLTSKTGSKLINKLISSETVFTIIFTEKDDAFDVDGKYIFWSKNTGIISLDGQYVDSPALALLHEMGHAAQFLDGTYEKNLEEWDLESDNLKKWERPAAKELGEYARNYYGDFIGSYRVNSSTDHGYIIYNVTCGLTWSYLSQTKWKN